MSCPEICPPHGGSDGKESACSAEDRGLIPGSGRYRGEGNGNALQSSCQENSVDWGYNPWDCKESNMTEQLTHFHFHSDLRSNSWPAHPGAKPRGMYPGPVQWPSRRPSSRKSSDRGNLFLFHINGQYKPFRNSGAGRGEAIEVTIKRCLTNSWFLMKHSMTLGNCCNVREENFFDLEATIVS